MTGKITRLTQEQKAKLKKLYAELPRSGTKVAKSYLRTLASRFGIKPESIYRIVRE
jgi:hypothetical protein